MSSSLDKLKALTNKLEEEIGQKKSQTIMPHVVHEKREETTVVSMVAPVNKSRKKKTEKAFSNDIRHNNKERVRVLYEKLKIYEKSPDFNNIFLYKAMNLSGIGLKEEDFGEAREGKYIQVIAITYEPDKNGKKRAKNISLGYFGKAETLEFRLKNEIIEFVLRWRYEKVFQNAEHYKDLIAKIDTPSDTLF
ncbi:MAG: hypothetical protein LGB07_01570 [Sulfurovum sp.]|nr:hypothetical protein [Sulfurovum sp.]MCB4744333.1 hypothetical protein [Sulfurovum sp.]MCB4750936.1 hypothetical protein [Sulfurovum sp.]MCB4753706.1 hypothetical protein [Sulfurovum sp.]MCB4754697.1 hypothetical protein [Sulfurovum sp.]